VQLSRNSFLAEHPSSRPNGKGTLMFPHSWEQLSFRANGVYPVLKVTSWVTFD